MEDNKKTNRDDVEVVEINEEELGEEFMLPDYRPKSRFTKKQVSKSHKRKLSKIAYASRRFNRKNK